MTNKVSMVERKRDRDIQILPGYGTGIIQASPPWKIDSFRFTVDKNGQTKIDSQRER